MFDSPQSTGVLCDGDASASCGAKRRIQWVDYGKGFAMLLVFWGHTICPDGARDVLYAFHMPLFYFLSGYVFSIRKYADFKSFVWRKFRTLIVPGAFFGAVCLIGDALNSMLMGEHGAGTLVSRAIGLFVELRGGDYYVVPWFFTSLFAIEIAAYVMLRHITQRAGGILSLGILLSLVGYLYCVYIGHTVPWALETACSGFLFFVLGYLVHHYGQRLPRWVLAPGFGVLWLFVTLVFALLNVKVSGMRLDIDLNHYGWYPFYMVAALSGVMMGVCFMRGLERLRCAPIHAMLLYVGRNSLIFYCFNQLALRIVLEIFQRFGVFVGTLDVMQQCLGLVIVALACVLCVPLAEFANRMLPGVMGKRHAGARHGAHCRV